MFPRPRPSFLSFFQSDVSQRGKRFDRKTKNKKRFDQTTVHVRPETKSVGRSAPVQSGAPSEGGEGAGCANLRLTSLNLSDLPLSVGAVSSTGNDEVGEDGGGGGAMQTNPMVPTNKILGRLQARSRHSSIEL